MPAPTNVRKISVLCGLPFSGKTTYAEAHRDRDTMIISRDEMITRILADAALRQQVNEEARMIVSPVSRLYSTHEDNARNDALTKYYVERVEQEIRQATAAHVIVDGTHLQPLSRSFVGRFPDRETVAVVCSTPLQVCLERYHALQAHLVGVRSTVTPDLLSAMSRVFEWPTTAENFKQVIIL